MNYLDLFHGIGGFALGAHWVGMKFDKHYCSDIEPFAQELYKKRFPDSIQLGDITKIDPDKLPKGEWIITGGFPCQDISIAGKGVGISGARSGLWFEMFRIIRALRPRYVIAENVSAITFRGLDRVLSSLAEIGYDVEWQDIRASDMGAPHRRERIWIVAYPNSNSLGTTENTRAISKTQRKIQGECKRRQPIRCSNALEKTSMANTKMSRQQISIDRQKQVELRRGNSRDFKCKRDWLKIAAEICRIDDGISGRVDRLKGLGNAIVPQIAKVLFELCEESFNA